MVVRAARAGTIPSRKAAVAMWRRRSAVVRFWRVALPATIVAILVTLIGWGVARGLMAGKRAAPAEVFAIQMTNGQFFGRDDIGRVFLVAANRAVRDARDEGRITLDHPTFNLGEGRAKANQGIYVDDSAQLILRGDVLIIDAGGQTVRTEEALIDTKTGIVTNVRSPGARGIQIESDMGKISADDYTIAKNGEVKFKGRVQGSFRTR